jgi:hypothetical protein
VIGLLLSLAATAANAQTPSSSSSFRVFGYLSARSARVTGNPSWLEGGVGRFDVGPKAGGDTSTRHSALVQLGADWTPTRWLLVHAHGVARAEPSGSRGKRVGVAEAYVELHGEKWRVRAGEFFLPTSRETTGPLWTSPYTLTYSALNTWMGEEVRPVGIDAQYSPNFYVTAGATVFRGNDTMGTLLSARGWSLGDRLTVYNERLPAVLDITRPIGPDLDRKNGYSERLRLQLPERAVLQFTHLDNRAPLIISLRGGEPWRTKFDVIGAELGGPAFPATIAAEWSRGSTALGFPGGSFTMDFDTVYVLLSRKTGHERWTLRAERFATRDADRAPGDTSREDGRAWTVAWMHEPNDRIRLALEYVKVIGGAPADLVATPGSFLRARGGSLLSAEIRVKF